MKIAYLILAHKDPRFIRRVSLKLTNRTENHVFIHVDKKADVQSFKQEIPVNEKISLFSEYSVYWGGYSMIEATIFLFKKAVAAGHFERFVLLQGSDYPICSNTAIEKFFIENRNVEYIRSTSETKSLNFKTDKHKYLLKYSWDHPDNPFWKILHCLINPVIRNVFPRLSVKPFITINGKKCEIYRGWAHIAITDSAVEYILKFHEEQKEYNSFFKHVYAPDESYFHTILWNSEFVDKMVDRNPVPQEKRNLKNLLNLTYFEYPVIVRTFKSKEEYEVLKNSGCLYFRKAGSESQNLLDYIDFLHESEDVESIS